MKRSISLVTASALVMTLATATAFAANQSAMAPGQQCENLKGRAKQSCLRGKVMIKKASKMQKMAHKFNKRTIKDMERKRQMRGMVNANVKSILKDYPMSSSSSSMSSASSASSATSSASSAASSASSAASSASSQ